MIADDGPPLAQSQATGLGLVSEHERLVAALKASRCGTWHWDIPSDVVIWDEALSDVYGIPHTQAPKNSREFLALVHPDDRARVLATLQECLTSGSEVDYEFRAVIGDRIVWIYDRSTLVRDAAGRPLYMTGACLDMTERRRIEEERNAALQHQKLLLKELNHRVKNHLQMIIGMLELKGARHKNPAVRADFEKAIARIETIADLHSRLYNDDKLGDVDMAAYLQDICDNLRASILPERKITLASEAEPVSLSVDQAVPIGLIVNELATNAIKHAFPHGRAGHVVVRLGLRGDKVALSVADDGCGMAAPKKARGGGVGRRMVDGLARQIGAEVTVTGRGGTSYEFLFEPASAAARRVDGPSIASG